MGHGNPPGERQAWRCHVERSEEEEGQVQVLRKEDLLEKVTVIKLLMEMARTRHWFLSAHACPGRI